MAELGAVASILQVADVGLRLSTTLFTFAETVASADKTVSAVSKDVSLTSSVLRELGKILDKGHCDEAYSDDAIDSAVAIVRECSDVFAEIDRMLIEKLPKLGSQRKGKASKITMALERFRWPYVQSKINLLQSNLERLKSSLLVILHVISLARIMKDVPSSADEGQTALVRDLIKSNQNHVRRYDELRHQITTTSFVNARTTMLLSNIQEETTPSGPHEQYDHERETRLEDVHHFIALFERLEEEVARPSYIIGPHSRHRIQRQISNVQERETRCLHRVHGEEAVTLVKNELRPEAVVKEDGSSTSLTGSLSRFRAESKNISKRPKLRSLPQDPNRDEAMLDAEETSTSNHDQLPASPTPQHPSDALIKTSKLSQRYSNNISIPLSSNVDSTTEIIKNRPLRNSSSLINKLKTDSLMVANDDPADMATSAKSSRPSLKSIVHSFWYRGKMKLTASHSVADFGRHHVDQTTHAPDYNTSFQRVAADSLFRATALALPEAKLGSDTTHHDTNDRRGSDVLSSHHYRLISYASKPQVSSSHSSPNKEADGSSTPLVGGSGHDVDLRYPTEDRMLDELLQLWTPINNSV